MDQNVRVRFAPSPTGALHIGGVRTALYNYLFAKKNGGEFILRVEDTDQTRFVDGAEKYIKESLEWMGIKADESPFEGGTFAPYRQSERKDIYQKYAQQLVDEGKAYYAFDTKEELDAMKERLKAAGVHSPQYNTITRSQMTNSTTLSEDEVKSKLDSGLPYVIRLKVPSKEDIRLNDLIRGWVKVHSSTIDDKILMKSDGMPTYHLANVVDDHLMEITHVIRGEEWLPSAPLHILLYQYFGWEDSMPQFAHLPLLLKPDGNGKLSKRDGDKHGFPVFPIDGEFIVKDKPEKYSGFRESGYLPNAFTNFLVLLGWNPGTEQEIFSMNELIEAFSIERIIKGGARFDIEKAKWFNQQYIKSMADEELAQFLISDVKANGKDISIEKAIHLTQILKERITFPAELRDKGQFYFSEPDKYDEKTVRKKWKQDAPSLLQAFSRSISGMETFTSEGVKEAFHNLLEENGVKLGQVMPALRLAVTGEGSGPDLMEMMALIGKEQVIKRIEKAVSALPVS